MKNILSAFVVFIIGVFFTGCSQKQYYEPKNIDGNLSIKITDLPNEIISFNNDGATYEDFSYVSQNGLGKLTLQNGFSFINDVDSVVLSADLNRTLNITDGNETSSIKLDKNVVSGSKKGDLLALGLTDNSIAVYSIKSKQVVLKEYFAESILNDMKIANPVFLDSIILFPTLDGKVAIIDIESQKMIKTMNIDPSSQVNNITFLKTVDDKMIVATSKKLFVFGGSNIAVKDIDIRHIVLRGKELYVATLDGNIIKYDIALNELQRKKFKFAKFLAMTVTQSKLYAVESQEFMIELDFDLNNYQVFNFFFDEDEKMLALEDKIYFEDNYLVLP